MKSKLLKNALIGESLLKYSRQEKHDIITELLQLENISQRELSRQLGIPYATVHDWVSLRQDNSGEKKHFSFSNILAKLRNINTNTFTDWGRIEEIREVCTELLQKKK